MQFTTEEFIRPRCNCRSVGECYHAPNADPEREAINAMVDAFADRLRHKLFTKLLEGKGGWDDPDWPREDIERQLIEHVSKGDMIDVAAFAMFAWNQED